MEIEKKVYTPPTLTVHGDVQEITQGMGDGHRLDMPFIHPPKQKPNFS